MLVDLQLKIFATLCIVHAYKHENELPVNPDIKITAIKFDKSTSIVQITNEKLTNKAIPRSFINAWYEVYCFFSKIIFIAIQIKNKVIIMFA